MSTHCKECGSEELTCMACSDDALESVRQQLAEANELHRMQLAAIDSATLANTRATIAERIGSENPYWTPAYADVCTAVAREIVNRERYELAESQLSALTTALSDKAQDWKRSAESLRLRKGQVTRERRGHEVLATCSDELAALLASVTEKGK